MTHEDYLDFVNETLHFYSANSTSPQLLHQFLERNLEKINQHFLKAFIEWTKKLLTKLELEAAHSAARVISNFGKLISEFPLCNRAYAWEISIAAYQNAALVFTQSTFPYDWARNNNSLGVSYKNRILGNTEENLEQAIEAYHHAIQIWTEEKYPAQWSMAQNNLASVYSERVAEGVKENIEKAIEACRNSLKHRSKESHPYKWANAQNTLGSIYYKRISDNRLEVRIQVSLDR